MHLNVVKLAGLLSVVSALLVTNLPTVVADDDAPFNEIRDTCGNDQLKHAVSYAANFFCTEKLTKAVPGFDCSAVGFEVVSASQQGAGDEAVYKGIFALTDQDQRCVIGFSGTIDWFGGTPKIVYLGIEKCGLIDYVGNCNQAIEIASKLAEPLEERSSEIDNETTEEKKEEEEEEEEEIAEDIAEEEEVIEIEKEEEAEILQKEEQGGQEEEKSELEEGESEYKDGTNLENIEEDTEESSSEQEEFAKNENEEDPREENESRAESMWDAFPEVEHDASRTAPGEAIEYNQEINNGNESNENNGIQEAETGNGGSVENQNEATSLQENLPESPQSNTTASTPEETPVTVTETSPVAAYATDEDTSQGEGLIGVDDGEEQEQGTSPNSEQGQSPNSEQAEEAMKLVEEELEEEEDMVKELEEDESTWNFKGSIDECSRFGVSPAEGIVFVCSETAYVCGFSLQFRERFLLLTQDPVVDGCDFGKISSVASSREECNFFPTNEHHLKRDGRQQEQFVQCPNGSLLSSYYMFCSQELDNYYCDGAVCDTCEAVSRKFLRH